MRALVGRYCDAVARFDVEAFADTWGPDAIWHFPRGEDLLGREAIAARYREARAGYALCVQEILSSIVDPAGSARWYVRELQWRKDGRTNHSVRTTVGLPKRSKASS